MGLGKTLTMISLVVAANQIKNAGDDSSDEEEKWLSSARTQRELFQFSFKIHRVLNDIQSDSIFRY